MLARIKQSERHICLSGERQWLDTGLSIGRRPVAIS
jgi:hypothetical protein